MSSEDRNPIGCSLFFFALGKKQVVHGLWRQAPGHPEQNAMLKFLANDFTLDRWKTAAMKNAYALLSKKRFRECILQLIPRSSKKADSRIRSGVLHARWRCEGCDVGVSASAERLAACAPPRPSH